MLDFFYFSGVVDKRNTSNLVWMRNELSFYLTTATEISQYWEFLLCADAMSKQNKDAVLKLFLYPSFHPALKVTRKETGLFCNWTADNKPSCSVTLPSISSHLFEVVTKRLHSFCKENRCMASRTVKQMLIRSFIWIVSTCLLSWDAKSGTLYRVNCFCLVEYQITKLNIFWLELPYVYLGATPSQTSSETNHSIQINLQLG